MPFTAELEKNLSKEALKNVEQWLNESKYAEYRDELTEMINAEKWQELEDAFFKVIEFGTGGIRGTTGVGSNRISRVTIGEATQALAQYVMSLDRSAAEKGIVIACDTRLSSAEFSRYAAEVCAGNGVKAYLFESFRAQTHDNHVANARFQFVDFFLDFRSVDFQFKIDLGDFVSVADKF